MIAGFSELDRGEIRFGEQRIDTLPPHQRNTGMVFQNYAIFPNLTVADNVAYGLKARKVAARREIAARVASALALVQLDGYGERWPHQLSGGQLQRVAIARALVIEPEVLLLDEPLSNLDAQLRVEMRGEIRQLQQQLGITAIYVTHDQEEALADLRPHRRDARRRARAGRRAGGHLPQPGRRRSSRSSWAPPTCSTGTVVAATATACEVEVGRHDLLVAVPRRRARARAITFSLRPEALRVVPPTRRRRPDGRRSRHSSARVEFLGPLTRLEAALAGGDAAAASRCSMRRRRGSATPVVARLRPGARHRRSVRPP